MIAALALATAVAALPPAKRHAWQRQRACPHATHFARHGVHAKWMDDMRVVCVIGDHVFYAAKPKPKADTRLAVKP